MRIVSAALSLIALLSASTAQAGWIGKVRPHPATCTHDIPTAALTTGGHGKATIVITDPKGFYSFDCGGRPLRIVGDAITIRADHCAGIAVIGNGNRVTTRLSAPATLSIKGNQNIIRYNAPGFVTIGQTVSGQNNMIGFDKPIPADLPCDGGR